MTMIYSAVTDCKYLTEAGDYIGCQVTFDKLGTVYFVANPTDTEAHGREIHQRAQNGDFGPISAYVPIRVEPTLEQMQIQTRNKRNQLLGQLDSLVSNPLRWAGLSDQEKADVAAYRTALLNVPQQPGFPLDITWPNKPVFVTNNTAQISSTLTL